LAFNTIGWDAQNVLFNTVDAIIGDPAIANAFGNQNPAETKAYIVDTTVSSAGAVSVTATSTAQVNATVTNTSTSAASALVNASGIAVGVVISHNLVNSLAHAYIDFTGAQGMITGPNGVTVTSTDDASITSLTDLKAISTVMNNAGLSIVADTADQIAMEYQFTTNSGSREVNEFDQVRLDDAYAGGGNGGEIYRFLGNMAETINFGAENYGNGARWERLQSITDALGFLPNALFNVTGSDSVAVGGLVSRNEVRSDVDAYIDNATVMSNMNITVTATESATINATESSVVESDGGSVLAGGMSVAVGGVIATNMVLSQADAYITGSTVTANMSGDVIVRALNDSSIISLVSSDVTAFGVAINATMAFNTIGYDAQNILFNAADTIFNTEIGNKIPAGTRAYIQNTDVTAGGEIRVTADSMQTINSTVPLSTRGMNFSLSNNATAVSVGFIVALNRMAGQVQAYIDTANNITASGGDVTVATTNQNTIFSKTSSTSMAVSGGTMSSTSVSVSAGIARNESDTDMEAFVKDVTALNVPAGRLNVTSADSSSIDAEVEATTITVTLSTQGSRAINGGGSIAFNKLTGFSKAYVDNTTVTVSGAGVDQGEVNVTSTSTARIDASVFASAIAGAAGTMTTPALSIGVAISTNEIGNDNKKYDVLVFVEDSTLNADQTVTITATSMNDIDSTIFALTAAIAASTQGAAGLSGAGAISTNDLIGTTQAHTDRTNIRVTGDDLIVQATDQSTIDNVVFAASLAGSLALGGSSGNISIGVSLSLNEYDRCVQAFVRDATSVDLSNGTTGNIDINAAQNSVIDVTSAAASVTAGVASQSGFAGTGGGAIAQNEILGKTKAFMSGTTVSAVNQVDIDAMNTLDVDSTVLLATVGVGVGGNNAAGASIGAAVAQNFIGFRVNGDKVPFEVQAFVENTNITASGAITFDAINSNTIEALVAAGSIAIAAAGSSGLGAGGSGVFTENKIAMDVKAAIDGASNSATGTTITFTAMDTSDIDAFAAAASLTGSFAGTTGVAISIGAAIARNEICNLVEASITNANNNVVSTVGDITLTATENATIDATSAAAALAAGFAGTTAAGLAGAGAESTNRVVTKTNAFVDGSNLTSAEDLVITATGNSDIDALVLTGAVGIGAGGTTGVGAAIGASLAQNFIGFDSNDMRVPGQVRAYIMDSNIDTVEDVTLSATGTETITANVAAGSVAIAAAGTTGVGIAGSGAISFNKATTDVKAFIDGNGTNNTIIADQITLTALDNSTITANTGAASVAASFAGTTGVALAIAVALSDNLIDNEVEAFIADMSTVTTRDADVTITATSQGSPALFNLTPGNSGLPGTRAALIAALDDAATIDEDDPDTAGTNEEADDIAADDVFLANLKTEVQAQGQIVLGDFRIDILDEGSEWQITDDFGLMFVIQLEGGNLEVRKPKINAIAAAASLAAGIGGTAGVSVAGAGAVSTNVVLSKTNAFINNVGQVTSASDVLISAADTSLITSTIVSASLSVGIGGTAGVGAALGASVARNFIGFESGGTQDTAEVQAYVMNSSINAADNLDLTANADQSISAIVLTGAVAVTAAGTAAIGGAGTGSTATNKLGTNTKAFIDGDGANGIIADRIQLDADNMSTINVIVGAASLAGSFAGTAGVSLAIGVALGENEIQNEVETYIKNGDTNIESRVAGVTLDTDEISTINAVTAAASISAGFAGTAGVALSGAGADSKNIVLTKANAYIDNSDVTSNTVIDLDASSTVDINSIVLTAALAVGAGGTAGVGASIGAALATNSIGFDRNGTRQPVEVLAYALNSDLTANNDITLDALSAETITANVFAGSVALGVGGTGGAGLAGAGVTTTNKIATRIEAYIDGTDNSLSEIDGDNIILNATDQAAILSRAGAASIAGSVGGTIGGSLAIGISLADNLVDNEVEAFIKDADVDADNKVTLTASSPGGPVLFTINDANLGTNLDDASMIDEDDPDTGGTNEEADDIAADDLFLGNLKTTLEGQGEFIVGDLRVTTIEEGSSWQVVDLIGTTFIIEDAGGNNFNVRRPTISSIAAAASLAVGVGATAGIAVAGAGAVATNVILTETNAYLDDSEIDADDDVTLTATNTSIVTSTVVAAALSAGVGGTAGVGASLGAALARNFIGFTDDGTKDAAKVQAFSRDTSISTTGDFSATANANETILSTVLAGSVAIAAAGTVAIGAAGSGVSATNKLGTDVSAFIDGDATLGFNVDRITLTASDNSQIKSFAGAASVSAAFAGTVAGALSIAIGLSQNEIDNVTSAYILNGNSGITTNLGNVTVDADSNTKIDSVAASASVALSFSGTVAVALSGAGAESTNVILSDTQAYIDNSVITSADNVIIDADNASEISAFVLTASLAVGASGTVGVGASIGAALARNFVGFELNGTRNPSVTQAYSMNSSINATDDLSITATGSETIFATVLAGSVAISAAGTVAVGVSGAGVSVENRVGADVKAFIDGSGSNGVIADTITIKATDMPSITSFAAAVSVSASVGGVVGVSLSVAVTLSKNIVDNEVDAYIQNATVTSRGSNDICITASSTSGNALFTSNTISAAQLDDASFTDPDDGGDDISNNADVAGDDTIEASLKTLLENNGQIIIGDLRVSSLEDGVAWQATDLIGTTFIIEVDGGNLSYSKPTINAIAAAASLAVGVGLGGAAVSGAGADSLNVVNTKSNAFVNTSTLDVGDDLLITANDDSTIVSSVLVASVAVAGGAVGVGASIGAAISTNLIGFTEAGASDPQQVQAYVTNSTLNNVDELTLTATADELIGSTVFAGAVALAVGGGAGAAAGSGVSATNKVATETRAFINGDGSGYSVGTLLLDADNNSMISSFAGAVAIGAALGGLSGSISVGVSLSENEISSITEAYIDNADAGITTTVGAITVDADSTNRILSRSGAAAVAVAAGLGAGISLAGAGSESTNKIFTQTRAFVEDSILTSQTNLIVDALDTSDIDAFNLAISAAVAVGGGAGLGASIGSAVSQNLIGFSQTTGGTANRAKVEAFTRRSALTIPGAITIDATSNMTIDANIFAGSVAVAASFGFAGAAAGTLVYSYNRIGVETNAFIDGDSPATSATSGITAGTLTINADDTSTINANVASVSLAVSIGLVSAAVAAGIAISENIIDNNVNAYVANISGNTLTVTGGAVNIDAIENATIDSDTTAAAAAVSLGASFATAAATAKNTLQGSTSAYIDNSANVIASTTIDVNADDTSTITSEITSISIAAGLAGISVGVSLAQDNIGNATSAYIQNSTVTAQGGDVNVIANSNPTITTTSRVSSVTVGVIAASASSATSDSNIASVTEAYVNGGNLTASGQLDIEATTTSLVRPTIDSNAISLSLGIAIGGVNADVNLGGRTRAYIDGAADVSANQIDIIATDDNDALPDVSVVAVSGFGAAFASADTTISRVSEAYIGEDANVNSGSSPINVTANSNTEARGTIDGVAAGAIGLTIIIANSVFTNRTAAHIDDGAQVTGGSLNVTADSVNTINQPIAATAIGLAAGAGVVSNATDTSITETYIGPATGSNSTGSPTSVMISGPIVVNADATSIALLAAGAVITSFPQANPTVRSYLGDAAVVESTNDSSIDFTAHGDIFGMADATGFAASFGFSVAAAGVTANVNPTVKAFSESGGSVEGGAITFESRLNVADNGSFENTANGPAYATVTNGAAGLIGGAAGSVVTVNNNPTVETIIGSGTRILSTGQIDVTADVYQKANADAPSFAGGLAVGIGLTVPTANANGTTTTAFNGTTSNLDGSASAATGLNVIGTVNAETESIGRAVGGGFGGITSADVRATTAPTVNTIVGSTGDINISGSVVIESNVETKANAQANALSIGGAAVSIINVFAKGDANIDTTVNSGGSVKSTNGNVAISALHNFDNGGFQTNNTIQASTQSLAIGAVSVGNTSVNSDAESTVDALVSAGATIAAGGSVSADAFSGNFSRAEIENAGGGAVSVTITNPSADANGTTRSRLLGNIGSVTTQTLNGQPVKTGTAGANSVSVTAQAADTALAQFDTSSGGLVTVTASSTADADAFPTVSAELGGTIVATSDISVAANSNTDADATARTTSGGLVDVKSFDADASSTPDVDTTITSGAFIESGGTLTISATHGAEPPTFSNGDFTSGNVSLSGNTFTFGQNHGLTTGDSIEYRNNGNASFGGLVNDETYSVFVDGPTTLRLGTEFSASGFSRELGGAGGVDPRRDEISFAGGHNLRNGDKVVYENGGEPNIGGLVDGMSYDVVVIDTATIKLRDPAITLDSDTFTTSNIQNGNEIVLTTSGNQTFADDDVVTYRGPGVTNISPFFVDITVVEENSTKQPARDANGVAHSNSNQIFLDNHGFVDGNRVVYTSNISGEVRAMWRPFMRFQDLSLAWNTRSSRYQKFRRFLLAPCQIRTTMSRFDLFLSVVVELLTSVSTKPTAQLTRPGTSSPARRTNRFQDWPKTWTLCESTITVSSTALRWFTTHPEHQLII
jgi:hypothetical protein